ncbi:hypothetical protein E2562_024862 [Oryza meyeriana var. granulata]|uniref:Uncharacterized protein n=1 Tax=Oryza meyeriana var. granulata TaxID=110450 RepID=A0A6G1CI51_9ORYZ|nr:hypothetical protein E2562_024862 [Oryza meyeriana var. granulata]
MKPRNIIFVHLDSGWLISGLSMVELRLALGRTPIGVTVFVFLVRSFELVPQHACSLVVALEAEIAGPSLAVPLSFLLLAIPRTILLITTSSAIHT